ncbi:MAG TPA: aspartate-semialdehyde dehydrogenase [Desulfomonilia bacterium]|nr:aspartate-semialdehyde dehydrogenase [Thermodesulfobacteriota bacterium]HWR67940.1 aspartate-semialdehyde dehydrogenase [Desulfomonilia bacterium]
MPSGLKIAVLEPTELVGAEIVKILEERSFPLAELVLLGSRRAAGGHLDFRGERLPVRVPDSASFKGVDLAFFSCSKALSGEFTGAARASGAAVIDLSSRHALQDNVPLVVPEVNAEAIGQNPGIIASPKAASIQLALTLSPIHKAARIRRITVTTFHAVSEIGGMAMDELTGQVRDLFCFREIRGGIFPQQMAFNVLPVVSQFTEGGYTEEELLIATEVRKILGDKDLRMSVTSIRMPVFYSHGAAVNLETMRKIGPAEVRGILEKAPGLTVEDEPAKGIYPTPIHAAGMDECLVGRIREDLGHENGIALWAVCDNIRKGSALNAVQIAEHLFRTRA